MSGGPRDYDVGTERALFRLASGTCYFPGCDLPVIATAEGHPIVSVDIAHIRGAKPGSARYDDAMTDQERAAFANLILLCDVHHKLVDRVEPDAYTVETLTQWKLENEPAGGLTKLGTSINEVNLEGLLEQIVAQMGPARRVEVDVLAGVVVGPADVLTMPLDGLAPLLVSNPHLAAGQRVIVANVRNVGAAAVSIEALDISFAIEVPEAGDDAHFSLLGRNDFGPVNPSLPFRLADGDAMRWYTKMETAEMVAQAVAETMPDRQVTALRAEIRLGSEEKIRSERVPWTVA